MNIVITGANRGLGLGFVRHYLEQGHDVWACYRSSLVGLNEIQHKQLHTVQLDVSQDFIAADLDLPERIDVLINNAGIYGPYGEQDLASMTSAAMLDVFNVDCIGPLRVVQQLQSRLIKAGGTIANISSKMGSSGDNGSGGTYAYRAAKAGLIIISKSMAIDLKPLGVAVITLHPGWVSTDMARQSGLIDVQTSVAGMVQVMGHIHDYDVGAFVAFDGQVIAF
ncbi:MAG: SDR family oxidoreductase [Mariprofundaceae bacterium]|nr:SDR family oxidoreductase [Mariprofundaceae bacterium]